MTDFAQWHILRRVIQKGDVPALETFRLENPELDLSQFPGEAGWTPLAHAVLYGQQEVFRYLLDIVNVQAPITVPTPSYCSARTSVVSRLPACRVYPYRARAVSGRCGNIRTPRADELRTARARPSCVCTAHASAAGARVGRGRRCAAARRAGLVRACQAQAARGARADCASVYAHANTSGAAS